MQPTIKQQNFQFERFPAYDGRGKPLSDFDKYDDQTAKPDRT
jgi:glycosyl transferase family 25